MSELMVQDYVWLERRGEFCQVAHIQQLEDVGCHKVYYTFS